MTFKKIMLSIITVIGFIFLGVALLLIVENLGYLNDVTERIVRMGTVIAGVAVVTYINKK